MEKLAAAALTICAALLFLIGFLYVFLYFNYYGIGMNELDLAIQDIITHSFASIRFSINSNWIFLSLLFLFVATCCYLQSEVRMSLEFFSVLAPIVIVIYLMIFAFQASKLGLANAKFDLSRNPIIVSGDETVDEIRAVFGNRKVWLRHLRTGAKFSHYLVQSHSGGTGKWVVRISKGSVISIVYLDQ